MRHGVRTFGWYASVSAVAVWLVVGCTASDAAAQQASIEGRIVAAETGEPIGAAHVVLQGAGSLRYAIPVDPDGRFRLPSLEPGSYRVVAGSDGYFGVDYPLVVKPREPVRLRIELPRATVAEQVHVRAAPSPPETQRTGSNRVVTRQTLDLLPAPMTRDLPALVRSFVPGAILSHDNFVHIRGNELSLHQFINGVSFLDNSHQHFTPGLSPRIFETVNFISGGFPAEFGNRFGGILDVTTRSGRSMNGHGSASLGLGTISHRNGEADYGGQVGRLGYYVYGGGFNAGRFLNPPQRREVHDAGHGGQGVAQLDYQGDDNLWKLLLSGGTTRFEIPNTASEQARGRNARRALNAQTAILTWQHVLSPSTLASASAYERVVADRLRPTSLHFEGDARASRATRTLGVKLDWYHSRRGHRLKGGVDVSALRLRESFGTTGDAPGGVRFDGRDTERLASAYLQDRIAPLRALTVDLGLRVDHFQIVESHNALSPRVGVAYGLRPDSVVRFAYNRLFTPPPVEYVLLADALGSEGESGTVQPYRQNYFEVGWTQRLHRSVSLDLAAYRHTGTNAFETSEIESTRLFLPTNFARARARGLELRLDVAPSGTAGLGGTLEYALARVDFFGPISGGFAGDEVIDPGELVPPAFDQRHTLTGRLAYHHPWRELRAGVTFRYGSGTPAEQHVEVNGGEITRLVRLPDHVTIDLSGRVALWHQAARTVDLELDVVNLTDNAYRIAKESEVTPIQFAGRRAVSARLAWRF